VGTNADTSPGRGSVLGDDDLRAALRAWDLATILSVRRHGRGLNSATWLVAAERGAWIAKAVPATAAAQFTAGLRVAAHLETASLRAGAPRLTRDGHLTVTVAAACLALLAPVAGRPLDPTNPTERRLWGATLGRAHRLLRGLARPPGVMGWHWVDPAAPHLDVAPWVRAAVREAVAALAVLQHRQQLTVGLLHADPGPSSFLVDAAGQVALIDWGAVTWGPLIYDVASLRLGDLDDAAFDAVLDGYRSTAPITGDDVAALPVFVRFRWAVQADYFARRIAARDGTGLDDLAENEQGLAQARRHLDA
jgi:Ser/Thr protein kinase RdoA (MazF antagonist)